jgi:hypothetical protein
MTRKEARQLWCPMVRYQRNAPYKKDMSDSAVNREGANSAIPNFALCVADLCPMWRWVIAPAQVHALQHADGKSWSESGYCGLGGKP